MKIEIKSIFGELIFEGDFACIADAVKAALAAKKSLRYADLRSADLRSADLRSADLRYADLRYADLRYADLRSADLRYADLRYADLRYADLPEKYFRIVRDDIWAVLSAAPTEAMGLRAAIADGKINGQVYKGTCACLVGTIANVRSCDVEAMPILKPDASRPAEVFFLRISEGDTPNKNPASKFALECVDQWLANMRSAFSPVSV